jgi:hypothetical protein
MSTSSLWAFMQEKDKKKLSKAGFATPRGGGKNAYQNHVSRSNRVIIPFERIDEVDLDLFEHGHVIRVLPEQCFASSGELHPQLNDRDIQIGRDAFVLYRTRASYINTYPPLDGWSPRGIASGGQARKRGVPDTGEYVVRLSNPIEEEGLPQGIFAPEYAKVADNLLCQALLAWLISVTRWHPYLASDFDTLKQFLDENDPQLTNPQRLERAGIVVDGVARCPLCLRPLLWNELHQMMDLTETTGLANAQLQIAGATRSTVVNLFHMRPLLYGTTLQHKPRLVAWGHAICNTLLGQRACVSLHEMQAAGFTLFRGENRSWGYSADDESMLRSDDRGAWARIVERGLPDVPLTAELGSETVIDEESDEDWDH